MTETQDADREAQSSEAYPASEWRREILEALGLEDCDIKPSEAGTLVAAERAGWEVAAAKVARAETLADLWEQKADDNQRRRAQCTNQNDRRRYKKLIDGQRMSAHALRAALADPEPAQVQQADDGRTTPSITQPEGDQS